jgi:hypothetical protein
MPVLNHCPLCGTDYAASAAGTPCPACLLQLAVDAPDEPQEPLPRSFGDFTLLEELGRGGMGVVYRAHQPAAGRSVALKTPRSGALADAAERHRFRVEIEAAANLQHPNIVAIHEVGEVDGQPYFTMDLVDGPDLADMCHGHPQPPRRAAEYLRDIARAVATAHTAGILHRDLKPSNVLVGRDQRPRVTDFGLAHLNATLDGAGSPSDFIVGSPGYIAPELAAGLGRPATTASDIYGLGALLYHLITGRAPYAAPTAAETVRLVRETDPLAPRALNPAIPRDLETICLTCLRRDPERRYATASLVAEEVERFLNGLPILARPLSLPGRAWRWARRRPGIATLAGSLLLVFSIAFIVSTTQAQRLARARRSAEQAFAQAQQLVTFLLDDVLANLDSTGRRTEVAAIAQRAAAYYAQLPPERRTRETDRQHARALTACAYITAEQGLPADALPSIERAIEILETLRTNGDASDETLVALTRAHIRKMAIHGRQNQMAGALAEATCAVELIEPLGTMAGASATVRREHAFALFQLGGRHATSGSAAQAIRFTEQARRIQVSITGNNADAMDFLQERMEVSLKLAQYLAPLPARREDCLAISEEALRFSDRILARNPVHIDALEFHGLGLVVQARLHENDLHLREAASLRRQAYTDYVSKAAALDPTHAVLRQLAASMRVNQRDEQFACGRVSAALQGYEAELREKARGPESPSLARFTARYWLGLGLLAAQTADREAVAAALQGADEAMALAWGGMPDPPPEWLADVERQHATVAKIRLILGDLASARVEASEVLARAEAGPDDRRVARSASTQMAHEVSVAVDLRQSDFPAVLARTAAAADGRDQTRASWLQTITSSTIPRSIALARLHRLAEARTEIAPAVEFLRAAVADNPEWCSLREYLARAVYAFALAQDDDDTEAREALLAEAAQIIAELPQEYRALRPVAELADQITAEWANAGS